MQCDVCGKESKLRDAIIEGSLLKVCSDCLRFGKAVTIEKPKPAMKRKIPQVKELEDTSEIIVDDYAEKIKKAREKKGMKQEQLAQAIAEKESLIQKLENGSIKPSLKLAKKLSVVLGIRLIEEIDEESYKIKKLDFKDKDLTIGDLIRIKKR